MRYRTPYSKISREIHTDEKFKSLSDLSQLLFFTLLTHTSLTNLGGFRATTRGLAAEKRWSLKRFNRVFQELIDKKMVWYDDNAQCLIMPHFLKHNPPQSPKVVMSWEASLGLIPECKIREKLKGLVREYVKELPESFRKALPKVFGKVSRIQIQSTDTEQIAVPKGFVKYILDNKYFMERFDDDINDIIRNVALWEKTYPNTNFEIKFEEYINYAENEKKGLAWQTFVRSFGNWLKPKPWETSQGNHDVTPKDDDGYAATKRINDELKAQEDLVLNE